MLSYQSANSFPIKLFKNANWFNKRLKPMHLQLNLTNKCNMGCSFCSCRDRDKNLEMSFEKLEDNIYEFYELGGEAVTITGGGEPLLYPYINEVIDIFCNFDIKIGLVTNGILLNKVKDLKKLTWCRISANNGFTKDFFDVPIDWALSYVITDYEDKNIQGLVDLANSHKNITHIRLVSNILNPLLLPKAKNDHKVIYQDRIYYEKGSKNCWIGLIKPYLDVSGKYYPCCGTQYAIKDKPLKMVDELYLGDNLTEIIDKQQPFDGSICDKCYYSEYNEFIDMALQDIKHLEFI